MFSCEDETAKREYPRVRTLEVTNITENGATFVAEVYEEGNTEITEHGFTWSFFKPDVNQNERVMLGSFSGTGSFTADISTTLEEGKTYQVTAFVKAGDYTVYGEAREFVSLGSMAPEVNDFQPHAAGWGDTITIFGRKFSYINYTNRVLIGDHVATVISCNDTIIKTLVPSSVIETLNAISVSINGNVAACSEKLTFLPPQVFGFEPKQGFWGDTITFTGSKLWFIGYLPADGILLNDILFHDKISETGSSVSFLVPRQLATVTNTVSLSIGTFTLTPDGIFTLLPPRSDSISPSSCTWKSIITLYGRFNSLTNLNTVLIDNVPAKIIYSSLDSLKVEVPVSLTNAENVITYKSGPFVVTFDDKLILKGPEIKSFTPLSGYGGQQLKITGKYFKAGSTSVKIGTKDAKLVTVNDTIIYCYIPGDVYGECTVDVSELSSESQAEDFFSATNHIISHVSPTSGSYGDTVTITGEYLRPDLTWRLGSNNITPYLVTAGRVQFTIPFSFGYTPSQLTAVSVLMSIFSTSVSSEFLSLNDFRVTSMTPLSGKAGDVIALAGENLNSTNLSVKIGTTSAGISDATTSSANITIPGLSTGVHEITITSAGRSTVFPEQYTHSGPWARLNDLPFLYDYGCVFDFGEDVYVATKESSPTVRSIFKFNPDTEGFEMIGGTFASNIVNPSSCVLNGIGYILGLKSSNDKVALELFNPDSLIWRSLPDYPGNAKMSQCFFADDSVIYAGCGKTVDGPYIHVYSDFWKYSPATNKWSRLANNEPAVFSNNVYLNGKLLVSPGIFGPQSLKVYDPASNSWTRIADSPCGRFYNGISNQIDGIWYTGFGDESGFHSIPEDAKWQEYNNLIYRYDPVTNTWSEVNFPAIPKRSMAISFTAGGYLYIGGDQNYHLYDFWKYDPGLDK